MNLERLFINQFDTPRISDQNLASASEDHLGKLIADNDAHGGRRAAMLAATGPAHAAFVGAGSGEDVATAVRQSLTRAATTLVDGFKDAVADRGEAAVRAAFGGSSATYLEFFPHGLTEYARATIGNVNVLMERMAAAARTHKAELGADFFNQYRAFRDNFTAARAAQVGQKGAVRTGKTTTATVRDALEWQLMDNLLVLARENIGHPERLKDFFTQSLLGPAFNAAPDNAPTPVAPTPAVG